MKVFDRSIVTVLLPQCGHGLEHASVVDADKKLELHCRECGLDKSTSMDDVSDEQMKYLCAYFVDAVHSIIEPEGKS